MKTLENLQRLLQYQNQFGLVYPTDSRLELPKLGFQIYWSESSDYPGTNRFFIFEDNYQVEVCDDFEEVISTIQNFLDDLILRFGEVK